MSKRTEEESKMVGPMLEMLVGRAVLRVRSAAKVTDLALKVSRHVQWRESASCKSHC